MGQRALVAIPQLYAQALNARPWMSPAVSPNDAPGTGADARPFLPSPTELGGDVVFELALLDRMPVALAIYDGNGVLVHANPGFDRLVAGRRLPSRAVPPERWTGREPGGGALAMRDFPCERALRGETVSPGVDLLHDTGDGSGRWLNVSAAPILDPASNAIVGLAMLFLETHDRVQADGSAAETARRFEQFAEQSSTAIWIADARGECFTYRNPRHLALANGSLGTVGGLEAWLERIDSPDRAGVRQLYALVQGGRTERLAYRITSHAGAGAHLIEETCFPIFDDAGLVVSIGGLATETAAEAATILYLVGDVAGPASPLRDLARARGGRVKVFGSLEQLLDMAGFLSPGCVVVDLAACGATAGWLDRALAEVAAAMPVILIGLPDAAVATAVDAMRHGAADYLIPPLSGNALGEAIRQASARVPAAPAAAPADVALTAVPAGDDRLARLSTREREVLAGLVGGGTNKSIARELAISPRTVELYRARLMERMNAGSLAELLRIAHDLGDGAPPAGVASGQR